MAHPDLQGDDRDRDREIQRERERERKTKRDRERNGGKEREREKGSGCVFPDSWLASCRLRTSMLSSRIHGSKNSLDIVTCGCWLVFGCGCGVVVLVVCVGCGCGVGCGCAVGGLLACCVDNVDTKMLRRHPDVTD